MAQNINLGGLTSPVCLDVTLGDYIGMSEINEAVINGAQTLPLKLLNGYADVV